MQNKTRYHLDNSYITNPLKFGNIRLYQIGRLYCESSQIISAHTHLDWFELTIITGGKGVVTTNGISTEVSAGDIYLSFPCDVHEIKSNLGDRLEYDFFAFNSDDVDVKKELKTITANYRLGYSRVFKDEKIADLVKNAISEFPFSDKQYTNEVLSSIFHLITLYLIRDFIGIEQKANSVSSNEVLCFQIMNYIDTHVYTLSNLTVLSSKFGYNYRYLSGLFKATTGKTLWEYLSNRKMEIAKVLIAEKKKKIGEIAETLGYNLYSFSKAFKAKYGTSPKEMQKDL